ncbi:hypothetical protein [Halomonas kalidii]|uniref:Uncharacterized protein n=1 Tax=Halomonas kalidii TaxID=3043293 RepID=A0ABT6VMG5_9GAMM|nr:hypothetical protein [Halomonas kalidii]MDI5935171.1 hypothetical protein [Halomonas kalidii]
MTDDDYWHVIYVLHGVIEESRTLLERFEATGMDSEMPDDYDRLHAIHAEAVKGQRAHTLAMLAGEVTMAESLVPPSPPCPPST